MGKGCSQKFHITHTRFSLENLILLQWATMKYMKEAICVSEIVILLDPKLYSSTILPTWFVDTCTSVRDSEPALWVKLAFLTFLTIVDMM